MTPAQNPLQRGEADARTRTGDPFITSETVLPHPVAPGHTLSPQATAQSATTDPNRRHERPQDAPSKTDHDRAVAALNKLIAIARGEWSDPDHQPEGAPPGLCDWEYCDEPATAWRWAEDYGGWIPVCADHEDHVIAISVDVEPLFCCDRCGGMFELDTEHDPQAEADTVFRPEELDGHAVLCETCWQALREANPHLDARYQEHDL